jgi:hypothetical protein
MGKTNMIS